MLIIAASAFTGIAISSQRASATNEKFVLEDGNCQFISTGVYTCATDATPTNCQTQSTSDTRWSNASCTTKP